jgi:peptidoglycan/LPS O-acetylase OafA/YrhL
MRAVAVLLVVLSHAQVTAFQGGFIGVDVFFVISGFVITGLLLRERSATGRTNILAFYGRRVRRIVPAAMGATVLVIAGGTAVPRWGAESMLRLPPFKWVGLWSYSIYLWHYPILILAAQRWHTSVSTNLLLMAGAIALSAGTYFAVENPIRHSPFLTRFPLASVAGGASLILCGLATVTIVR